MLNHITIEKISFSVILLWWVFPLRLKKFVLQYFGRISYLIFVTKTLVPPGSGYSLQFLFTCFPLSPCCFIFLFLFTLNKYLLSELKKQEMND